MASAPKLKPGKEIIIKLKNGLQVAAKTWGSINASHRVLALHGWLDNAGSFDTLAPQLAENDMQVVAIDFIGHGRSQHVPPSAEPYFVNYVLQVIDVASALGWESFNIVAHSMGAGVASIVAAVAADRVSSMVLFDALGPISSNGSSCKQLEDAIRDRHTFLSKKPRIYRTAQECVNRLLTNNQDIAECTAKNIVTRGTIQVEGGFQFVHDMRLLGKSMTLYREEDVLDYLSRIRCPVLILWAENTVNRFTKTKKPEAPFPPKMAKETSISAPAASVPSPSPSGSVPLIEAHPDSSPNYSPAGQPEQRQPGTPPGFGPGVFNQRMAQIQHLTCFIVPGSHHVHSDNPDVVLQHMLPFLLPPKSKL